MKLNSPPDLYHSICPCRVRESKDDQKPYSKCCQIWHDGLGNDHFPAHALNLMRSRYSAFAIGSQMLEHRPLMKHYLERTWHSSTRPLDLMLDDTTWTGLKIIQHNSSVLKAMVEFVAYYKMNGRTERLQEKSQFEKVNGQWQYVVGTHLETQS